jgi:hypothetical protein
MDAEILIFFGDRRKTCVNISLEVVFSSSFVYLDSIRKTTVHLHSHDHVRILCFNQTSIKLESRRYWNVLTVCFLHSDSLRLQICVESVISFSPTRMLKRNGKNRLEERYAISVNLIDCLVKFGFIIDAVGLTTSYLFCGNFTKNSKFCWSNFFTARRIVRASSTPWSRYWECSQSWSPGWLIIDWLIDWLLQPPLSSMDWSTDALMSPLRIDEGLWRFYGK